MKNHAIRNTQHTALNTLFRLLPFALLLGLAFGQGYRNVVNRPFATVSNGPQSVLIVDLDRVGRSPESVRRAVQERVYQVTRVQIESARPVIRLWKRYGLVGNEYRFPIHQVVLLRQSGRLILPPPSRGDGLGNGTLRMQFSTKQEERFPSDYERLLQRVWNAALPQIEAWYGKPAQTRTITIINYDAQMGDRDAVAGGVYVVTQDLFLFPFYSSAEAAAVNLVHLMVHAFHGGVFFDYDAWEEGFARAITAKVVRSPQFKSFATGLGLKEDFLELTLKNTYDARSFYDFWNQPTLGNPSFIAPSLKQSPIEGGTTGGLWLVRYLMAGSAWLKVLTQYPNFCKEFNARYYAEYDPNANPKLSGNVPRLVEIAAALTPAGVEGRAFPDWYRRQFILDTSVTYGRKLHAQLLPYVSGVSEGESAVFMVILTYFRTFVGSNGLPDESLLNGTCYPIYWDSDYNRLFLAPQYERVEIRGGTGAVVPSITDLDPQRVTVDFSVRTESVRVVYPAGKVQGVNFRNDFFGVIYGFDEPNGTVEIVLENGVRVETPVSKGAFGVKLPAPGLDRDQKATLTFKDQNGQAVGTVQLNTGLTEQGVLIFLQATSDTFTLSLKRGLHMMSLPLRPFTTDVATLLGIPANELLLASWRQELFRYVYYPQTPPPAPGIGYFLQLDRDLQVQVRGVAPPANENVSLGLQVGWNLIGNPLNAEVPLSDLRITYKFDEPVNWQTAVEQGIVGAKIFTYLSNPVNPYWLQYVEADKLQPGKAYWVRVLKAEGATLTVSPPARGRAQRESRPSPQWFVRLNLTMEGGPQSTEVRLGLDPKAREGYDPLDTESPPPFGTGWKFGIEHKDWGAASGFYLQDVRPGGRQEWELVVQPAQVDKAHVLRWHFSSSPRRWRVILYDTLTGQQVDMRIQQEYRFVPRAERRFKVRVEPVARTPLRLMNLQASPSRGGVTIRFSLSNAGTVRAEVRNLQGQRLRLIEPSRAIAAGVHSLVWNGRDAQERAVPPGTYLIHLEAVDQEGRITRAVLPLILNR